MRIRTTIIATMVATMTQAQGVIDVHSHIITPEFVSALESEGRLLDEGFPLPKWDAEAQLKWMDEAGIQTSVLTLAAPQPQPHPQPLSKGRGGIITFKGSNCLLPSITGRGKGVGLLFALPKSRSILSTSRPISPQQQRFSRRALPRSLVCSASSQIR